MICDTNNLKMDSENFTSCRVEKGNGNIFSPHHGNFQFNNETGIEFFEHLNAEYKSNKTACWAEKQNAMSSGIMLDFDMYQSSPDPQVEPRHVEALARVIAKTIGINFAFGEFADDIHIAVIQRPLVSSSDDPRKKILPYCPKHKAYKTGLHFLIPEVQISRDIKKYLNHAILNEIECSCILSDLIFTNEKHDPILDMASSYVPVFFLGSIKPNTEGRSAYPLKYVWKFDPDIDEGDNVELTRVNISKKKFMKHNLPLELSLTKWGHEALMRKETRPLSEYGQEKYDELAAKNAEESKRRLDDDQKYMPSDAQIAQVMESETEFMRILSTLLAELDINRAVNTGKWLGVLTCVKNIQETYGLNKPAVLAMLDEFSRRSTDNYIGSIEALGERYDTLYGRGYMNLLFHFLWTDKPGMFKHVIRDWNRINPPIGFKYYRDYKMLMAAGEVSMDTVKKWADAALVYIENGGKSFILTKNLKHDPDSRLSTVVYDTINICDLLKTLDVRVLVLNPKFKPDEDESKTNRKYLYESLKDALRNTIFMRTIPNYNKADFCPYLYNPPKLRDCFNIFSGFEMVNYQSHVELQYEGSHMHKHIRDTLCNGDMEAFNYIDRWIAYMIQYPALRPDTAPLFVAEQGVGKDLFGSFVGSMLGSEYTLNFDNIDCFFSNFNIEQRGKIFIVLNEISDKGTAFNKHDRFKGEITKEYTRIEPKGVDPYRVRHTGHYMCFSNKENCVYVENSDRRFVMIKSSNAHANDHTYFKPLLAEAKNKDFIKAAFDYYANMDLSEFNVRKIPMTKFKEEQKVANLPVPLKFIMDIIREDIEVPKHVSMRDLHHIYFDKWCSDGKYRCTNLGVFKAQLAKAGIVIERPYIDVVLPTGETVSKRPRVVNTNIEQLKTKMCSFLKMPNMEF
jgi:hypothetical protein